MMTVDIVVFSLKRLMEDRYGDDRPHRNRLQNTFETTSVPILLNDLIDITIHDKI